MRTLFCVLGRSAAGKDTLVNAVCDELGLKRVITNTTRPKRHEFEDTYNFTNVVTYEHDNALGEVAAHTQIGPYHYWATKQQLQNCDFYIIDYDGLKDLVRNNPNLNIVTLYIFVPLGERIKRARLRQPQSMDAYYARLKAEDEQFEQLEQTQDYDYIIINESFNEAKEEIIEIINKELQ